MTNAKYRGFTGGLIGAWFVFAFLASALHLFRTDPSRPPIMLGLAVLTPLLAFAAWSAVSEGFRGFTQSLSPRTLTFVQSWRIAGYVFLVLYTYGILPGVFALPAGWGDVAIGLTAAFVATRLANPERRKSFIVWQGLGIFDLVMAVTLGTAARLLAPHSVATTAMTTLPLSLIPTFAVPFLMILHLICIAQARQWSVRSGSNRAETAAAAA